MYMIAEALRRLRIQTNEKDDGGSGGGGDTNSYPDRPGEPDCIYYMRTGMCGYGPNCRFNHPSNLGLQYAKNGEFWGLFGGFAPLPRKTATEDANKIVDVPTRLFGVKP